MSTSEHQNSLEDMFNWVCQIEWGSNYLDRRDCSGNVKCHFLPPENIQFYGNSETDASSLIVVNFSKFFNLSNGLTLSMTTKHFVCGKLLYCNSKS